MVSELRWPLLLVVADREYVGDDACWLDMLHEVGEAARGEPVAIQVRAKSVTAGALRGLAAWARKAVPDGVPLFLNGDAALAAECGYDGVHWPEAATPLERKHALLRWRSKAVHSVDAARAAERAGADMLVFGSVYEPVSHPGTASGVEALRVAVRATLLPVIAIGGITPECVGDCLEAGARGVAVVSGVLGAPSPVDAVRSYLAALAATTGPRVTVSLEKRTIR